VISWNSNLLIILHQLYRLTVFKESILKLLKLDSLVDNVTGYVEARIELLRIDIKEEIAKGLAKALVIVVMIAVFTLFVMMISVAAAYKVGESIGMFGGFASVASFYLLVGLLVFTFRNPIIEKLEKQLDEKMKNKKKAL